MRFKGVVAILAVLALTAWAGKGNGKGKGGGGGDDGGGAGLTGRIYFLEQEEHPDGGEDLSMNPDGTGRSSENLPDSVGPLRNMSNDRHGGDYWFLDVRTGTGTNPDGSTPRVIVALRDDGAGGFEEVQLTTPATGGEKLPGVEPMRWAKDDSFVSFISIRWPDGAAEAHLYKAPVTWDGVTGEPSLGTETAVLDLGSELFTNSDGKVKLVAEGVDWAPNGDEVVLSLDGDLVYTDVSQADPTRVTLASGILPIWSPDGVYVAYRDGTETLGGSLYVVAPGGGSALKLVDASDIHAFARPVDWTPDSEHVAFTHMKRRRGFIPLGLDSENHDIARVPVAGGKITLVTDTKDADETLVAWRDD